MGYYDITGGLFGCYSQVKGDMHLNWNTDSGFVNGSLSETLVPSKVEFTFLFGVSEQKYRNIIFYRRAQLCLTWALTTRS